MDLFKPTTIDRMLQDLYAQRDNINRRIKALERSRQEEVKPYIPMWVYDGPPKEVRYDDGTST